MKYDYDIICIGAGSGGLNIAGFMNRAGFKTLLIDKKEEDIGGDCLNFGCVPSKALIHASRLVHDARRSTDFGLEVKGKVDIKKVVKYIRDKKDYIREHESKEYFQSIGMDVEIGHASFVDEHTVKVGEKNFSAKKIVIATGSRARALDIPGVEKVKYYTNLEIFDIDFLPDKLVIIGGGPIGMEIGQAFQRLGSQVTVLIRGEHFLPKEKQEVAEVLLRQLQKEGMEFKFNTSPKEILSEKEILVESKDGKQEKLAMDALFVGIGRVLNVEGLELEKACIETYGGKIKVDDQLRTTNKDVLLCGDIAGGMQFTHMAEVHAGVIISNFFSPIKKKFNTDKFSWVTFTDPEIATFGLNETRLKMKGIEYEKLEVDFSHDDRAIVDDVAEGKTILYVSKGKLVGGTMVAPNAGELFQELVLANSADLDVKHIFGKTYPYPTATRINKRAISEHFAKKLTPKAKKILKWMY